MPSSRIVSEQVIRKVVDTPGEHAWVSDRGTLTIRWPVPSVLLYVETGHLHAGFAPHIVEAYETTTRRGVRPHVFVDCERLVNYDPEVRRQPTAWIQHNRQRIVAQHMLVRSRFTRMGLQLVSMFLGGVIVGHNERRTFEQAMREAVVASSASETSVVSL